MLTPTQLAAKRKSRTMSSRTKAKAKAARIGRHLEDQAQARGHRLAWLSDLARQQKAQSHRIVIGNYSEEHKARGVAPLGIIARARALFRGVR